MPEAPQDAGAGAPGEQQAAVVDPLAVDNRRHSLLDVMNKLTGGKGKMSLITRVLLLGRINDESKKQEIEATVCGHVREFNVDHNCATSESDALLKELLTEKHDSRVTGLLYFVSNNFVQLVEGPTASVMHILKKPQHAAVGDVSVLYFTEMHGQRIVPQFTCVFGNGRMGKNLGDDVGSMGQRIFHIYRRLLECHCNLPEADAAGEKKDPKAGAFHGVPDPVIADELLAEGPDFYKGDREAFLPHIEDITRLNDATLSEKNVKDVVKHGYVIEGDYNASFPLHEFLAFFNSTSMSKFMCHHTENLWPAPAPLNYYQS